jgi:hypothetical protein
MGLQAPSAVVLVRPTEFAPNPETASDNAFQTRVPGSSLLAARAREEVSALATALEHAGVAVHLFEDAETTRPDSVFPNNWLSTHADGRVALFPMFAPNRRGERRVDVIEMLKARYRVATVTDYSGLEQDGLFLEGTGAMVLDHQSRVAYAARSHRADPAVLDRFCTDFGYEPVLFDAVDDVGIPIYHTNVMMCIATEFVLIGAGLIRSRSQGREVVARLAAGCRAVIELSSDQIGEFAGNAIELSGAHGRVLVLSSRAHASLRPEQLAVIERSCRIVAVPVPTIELGGGSVRCMIAGIHLDERRPVAQQSPTVTDATLPAFIG